MELKVKYSQLISQAQQLGVQNLSVTEDNNVLHISGSASEDAKEKLWDLYGKLDPDMRAGDLILNIDVDQSVSNSEMYEVKSGDNLSKIAHKYPGLTWRKIYEANKDTISDPDKIFPGQKIKIPKA